MLIRKLTTLFVTILALLFAQLTYAAPGDVLSSFTINNTSGDGLTPTTPQGMTYFDGYLWVVDSGTDRIFRVYPYEVLDTDNVTVLHAAGDSDFNIPLEDNPTEAFPTGHPSTGGGLTSANNFLWNASPTTDDIIKIDPVDGDNIETEVTLSAAAFPSPSGITFDGTYFWIVDRQTNTLNKVLAEDGSVLSTISGPSILPSYAVNNAVTNSNPFGITWDGQALWVTDQEEDKIYRVNPDDGSILTEFAAPASSDNLKGITWDGESLWAVDRTLQTIFKIESGVIPFGIIGCIEKNGVAVSGDVLLSQSAQSDQFISTDTDGCFTFPTFASGSPIQVKIGESGIDQKPVITLTGGDVTLLVGETYVEQGFFANDVEDGDISGDVTASPNTINTSVEGPVEGTSIAYDVIDSEGNNADTVYRTVYVLGPDTEIPVITLLGAAEIDVEQGTTYTELNATALDNRDGDITAQINITTDLNTNVVQQYTVNYDVSDAAGNNAVTVTRLVNVKDTTIPVIVLEGANPLTLERGDIYSEPGATATDNIDGTSALIEANITGNVAIDKVGTYILNYNFSDNSGNPAITVTRTITVIDTVIPVIFLLGDQPFYHELNTPYTDPGATAEDPPADNISLNIAPTSTVNISTSGSYTITYEVSDTSGNQAIPVIRDVIVADTGIPTITLLGDTSVTLIQGTPFDDPGATATDAVDDDMALTAKIQVTGFLDIDTLGSYTRFYDVSDDANNPAITLTRTIDVVEAPDTILPTITLLGDNPLELTINGTYNEPGYSAADNKDGDLSGSVIVDASAINTSVIGSYLVIYTVSDTANNSTTVTRTVNVSAAPDTTLPVITLLGANPIEVVIGSAYNEPGYTATDNIDGTITGLVVVDLSAVNPSVIGSYPITYNVSDQAGNAALTVTRTVTITEAPDTTPPTITLLGNNPLELTTNDTYVEPGFTAADNKDGDLSGSVVVDASAINTGVIGSYSVTYTVLDSASNSVTITRVVNVSAAPDTTLPVITLLGANPFEVVQGSAYNEPGYTASDNLDGTITGLVTVDASAVNTSTIGSYSITYNVSDQAGNAALTVTRTVTVTEAPDTTPPTITLLGDNPLELTTNDSYVEPGFTAADNKDGDLSGSVVVDASAVNTSVIGSYSVTYTVLDSASNSVTVTRLVGVSAAPDTTLPVITLLGANPIEVVQGSAYNEPGYTATDIIDGTITGLVTVDASAVNTSVIGSYPITYNVSDQAGNAALTVTRTVTITETPDITPPTITLLGDSPLELTTNDSYVDPGFTAADNKDGNLSSSVVVNSSAVNTSVIGSYSVTYSVSDSASNSTIETRTVNVSAAPDTTLPVITLLGNNPIEVVQGSAYNELGYTATDNIDGTITGLVTVDASAVNTSIIGSYPITYNVSDQAGNAALTVTRTVNVVAAPDITPPTITLLGANPLELTINDTYVDPGHTATDNIDGVLTNNVNVDASAVNTSVIGSYSVIYTVSDNANNSATVTRVVNVSGIPDTTLPVIALIGANPIEVVQGSSYNEPGYVATDNIDGTITGLVVVDFSSVSLNIGSYPITYNVSDQAGNAALTVIRTIIITAAPDATPPSITIFGDNPQEIIVGDAYIEQGATANDNFDGDISGSIVIDTSAINTNAVGSYSISYSVLDSSSNSATEFRTLNVLPLPDTTLPVLTLVGDNPQSIIEGHAYTEQGATANDNQDGDITPLIIIDTSSVNTSIAGTYAVTYNVSDNAGNTATTLTRSINVIPLIKTFSASPGMTVSSGSAVTTMNISDDRQIADLNVFIDLPHGRPGDIILTLTSPSNTSVVIMDRPGTTGSLFDYGCANDDINATFDDEGSSAVESVCNSSPGISGIVIPQNALNAFDGESSQGLWTLEVQDAATITNTGTLNSWSLETIIQ